MRELERAWRWRAQHGLYDGTEAVRIFHGPGEGSGTLSTIAIDRFGDHAWITEWEKEPKRSGKIPRDEIMSFLRDKGFQSGVALWRPQKGLPDQPEILFGNPPEGKFSASEGPFRFQILLRGSKHPGLFLDHFPLRQWLYRNSKGWKVLNTFAYTGSLSVAAGHGRASEVTTLDLSRPSVEWAKENWSLNGLDEGSAQWVVGDVFEWLPRMKRDGRKYDCVILDPPSFSRGKKENFSTAKDLKKLHALAMGLLERDGVLVTSINSANISRDKFELEVYAAARESKLEFDVLAKVDLPETFPTRLSNQKERYLKGLILRRST